MYPNPAKETAYLDLKIAKAANVNFQVVNLLGQVVATEELGNLSGSQLIPVDVNHLPSGIYQIKIRIGDQLLTQKLEVVN